MTGTIVQFGLPLLVTILFMFVLRPIARVGVIGRPGGRKMHSGKIAVIDGLAMAGGLAAGSLYSHEAVQGFSFHHGCRCARSGRGRWASAMSYRPPCGCWA